MGLNLTDQKLKVAKVRRVKTPNRGTPGSAGIDFFVPDDHHHLSIAPSGSCFIPSGIKANVPPGFALIAMNKSGIALKKQLIVGACVVDSDYQGEIHLHMINTSDTFAEVSPGDKLVQFLLVPVDHGEIEEVPEDKLFTAQTSRGSGGFGSTGVS